MSNRGYILISFAATILVAKLVIAVLDARNLLPTLELHYGSLRIHHITFGIIIVGVAGYLLATRDATAREKNILALSYGAGLGLIVDELWLSLETLSPGISSYPGEYFSFRSYLPTLFVLALLLLLVVREKNKP